MVIDGEAAATHGRKDKAVVAMGMGQVDETATVTMGRKRPCTLGKVEQWHMLQGNRRWHPLQNYITTFKYVQYQH